MVDVVSTKKNSKTFVQAKSRLTDSLIDKLHNYFGIALRSNVSNAKDMIIIIKIITYLFIILRYLFPAK